MRQLLTFRAFLLVAVLPLACTTSLPTEGPIPFPEPPDSGPIQPGLTGGRRPTAIDLKYTALGGSTGLLGAPVTSETPLPDGAGRVRHFKNGSIYWSASTGAHEVHGAIHQKWLELGAETGLLGYPQTDERDAPDGIGRFNDFQGGSIYWSADTGAHDIYGAIAESWNSLGGVRSVLGYPLTGELPTGDAVGRYQLFER
ncbi:MAG: hypothetical protein L0191_15470 [Acidobacteria bacterium]|nr:hypothetical protein [Acidobacteriota bacterium]